MRRGSSCVVHGGGLLRKPSHQALRAAIQKNHGSEFDYLVAMDQSNKHNMLVELKETDQNQVMLMRDFDSAGRGKDVPDPWFGGMKGFDDVYDILDRSIEELEELISYLRKEHDV